MQIVMRKDKGNTDGALAESMAADYLQRRGLTVLERNFRVRGGEIDLVCQEGESLVFVEVRLRRNVRFGGGFESIDKRKQARIILAAKHYLGRNVANNMACRFDCISLDRLDLAALNWVRNAFTLDQE